MASSSTAFSGIAPHPSQPSSTLIRKAPYDVFINHRGSDTKHKLASTIYHTLDLVGIRAFLDQEELQLGDSIPTELQEAIASASLHIAIFSENYAQSPWCLAELSFMLKTGNPIIPVFYHVKPDDLRWVAKGKGIYANAFYQHQKKRRYSSKMLREWKTALQDVSYMSGYMLNNDTDDEGRILKSIVNSVLKVVKTVPLEVAKYPVAMDEIVQDFESSTLQCGENEQHVQIVGIVGFGGAGKTTLALELYNRKCPSINRTSFLFDVRDAAARNALHDKQKKLLQDLRFQNESFDNIKEGKGILSNRLISLCVLIVLDDVDHQDQLDALLPPKYSLGPGSLIIVTTREGSILTNSGITSVYRMKALHHSHAEQLFCWHAFLRPSPLEGFEDLAEKFLNVCNGLPLSLKVIGAQLYGRNSKDYWESQLHKIQRILPTDIKNKLKVSYEALDEDEREIFLDIACFFIGEIKSLAIDVWDGSGWSGLCSWENLFSKCLVELDEKDCIRMHDHLRDLGRELAMTHPPSRLFFPRQSIHIHEGMLLRGIKAATGEVLQKWWSADSPWSRDFSSSHDLSSSFKPPLKEYTEMMKNSSPTTGLQLLVIKENDLTQEFAEVSRELVWLRWFDFKHRNLPSWLSLGKLRVLELYQPDRLEELWEDDARLPLELRELVIGSNYTLRRLPKSLCRLKHLKKICLISSLEHLPEEFCLLQSLEHLHLESCYLKLLPTHFGDLVSLRHINLSICRELMMLPGSFKQLKFLEYLNLYCCTKLTLASEDFENITKLKVLNFLNCMALQELPRHITNQASLKELNLRVTDLRELPANIGELMKLERLEIGSSLLTSLPTSLGNLSCLTNLTISWCKKLESLPVLSCPSLETLDVHECDHSREIETLPTALKFIKLSSCRMLKKLIGIRVLPNLQRLQINSCPELDEMSSLAGLVSLKEFEIRGSPKMQKLEGLQYLKSLETLTAHTEWKAPGIESLEELVRLRKVEVVADNRLALQPCIQIQIEKWACEMIVCGRAAHDAWATLDSLTLTFPNLHVINLVGSSQQRRYDLPLNCPKTHLCNPAIICFIIQSHDGRMNDNDTVHISAGKLEFSTRLKGGTWVVIGVYTQGIGAIGNGDRIPFEFRGIKDYKGILIVGVEGRVIHVLNQLFQLLNGG